jgi:hypothetical protein
MGCGLSPAKFLQEWGESVTSEQRMDHEAEPFHGSPTASGRLGSHLDELQLLASGGRQVKRARAGRPRLEERGETNEARKPWLKLSMSRRTWYRRQAEKRKGRE